LTLDNGSKEDYIGWSYGRVLANFFWGEGGGGLSRSEPYLVGLGMPEKVLAKQVDWLYNRIQSHA